MVVSDDLMKMDSINQILSLNIITPQLEPHCILLTLIHVIQYHIVFSNKDNFFYMNDQHTTKSHVLRLCVSSLLVIYITNYIRTWQWPFTGYCACQVFTIDSVINFKHQVITCTYKWHDAFKKWCHWHWNIARLEWYSLIYAGVYVSQLPWNINNAKLHSGLWNNSHIRGSVLLRKISAIWSAVHW